jgi:hypothetical protein
LENVTPKGKQPAVSVAAMPTAGLSCTRSVSGSVNDDSQPLPSVAMSVTR